MKNKKFLLGVLVMVLAFGMTVVGCGEDEGDKTGDNKNSEDTWIAVTSLAQLNGTWKGSYTQGPAPISDFFGAREDDGNGGHDVDLTEEFGNMMVTIASEMTSTINASAQTLANTDITTMTFSGGKINQNGIWAKVKADLVGESDPEKGVTVTYIDSAHSATIKRVESAQIMEDEEIAMLTSGLLQINQSGNKIKLPAGMMGDGSPEVILSKQ